MNEENEKLVFLDSREDVSISRNGASLSEILGAKWQPVEFFWKSVLAADKMPALEETRIWILKHMSSGDARVLRICRASFVSQELLHNRFK
ncbi:hypothetical protein DENSPDRAFT_693255 [Dentipellis sp. KUC8613]|nr:hypothetical protein DENSPDRAFT_693255 [Dentipellis sp. KUC8613]